MYGHLKLFIFIYIFKIQKSRHDRSILNSHFAVSYFQPFRTKKSEWSQVEKLGDV